MMELVKEIYNNPFSFLLLFSIFWLVVNIIVFMVVTSFNNKKEKYNE